MVPAATRTGFFFPFFFPSGNVMGVRKSLLGDPYEFQVFTTEDFHQSILISSDVRPSVLRKPTSPQLKLWHRARGRNWRAQVLCNWVP